jgi:acid phosphatase type 7
MRERVSAGRVRWPQGLLISPLQRAWRALGISVFLVPVWISGELGTSEANAQTGEPIGVLLAAGDITGCKQTGSKHAELANRVQKEIDAANGLPVGILVLGDVAYAHYAKDKKENRKKPLPGTYHSCFEIFKTTWGVYKDRLLPVPGNHDYTDDIPETAKKPTAAKLYKEYFADRIADLKRASGGAVDPNDKRLSFATPFPNAEGWLLVGMNFYGSEFEPKKWLANQLSSSSPRCVLVFTHPFYISSGEHGKGKAYEPMARVLPVLYDRGATVLVTAHDHSLEQFPKVDGSGVREDSKGIRSFVVGTGGATLYTTFTKHPLSEQFSNKSRGFLKLTLYRDGYQWSFISVDGPVVDLPVGQEACNRKPS